MTATLPRPDAAASLRFLMGVVLAVAAALTPAPAQTRPESWWPESWWKVCKALPDDRARLACFDTAAPHGVATADRAAPVMAPVAPAGKPYRSEDPIGYRINLGYGLGIGSHAGFFEVNHGTLTSTAGIGSDGDVATAQFWIDHWIGRDWSIGLEYMYINSMGKLILDLPEGAEVLTDPINAHTTLNAHGHLGYVNVAYRPDTKTVLQPYIGTGLGVGWGAVNADLGAYNAFVGSYTYTQRSSTMFGALQGFMGIDVAIGPHYYASSFAKAVWMPGRPFFKIHQRYLEFVLGGGIGRRF